MSILLPPFYALLMPLLRLALTQWRIRLPAVYKRVFTAAAISLSYACASLAFRGPGPPGRGTSLGAAGPGSRVTLWLVLVAACAVVQLAVNQYLVFAAVKAVDPSTRAREFIFGAQTLRNDLTELCMAVLSTLAIAMSLLTVVVALPLATLLQRSALHVQLMKDARTDSKTGLLNAATWERGATAEMIRAVRTKTQLAVALLDIDRFKSINDTYGHLTGDEVLKEISHTLGTMLREYDLAGRFGGEEFALLLPQTRAVDAFRIAERIRAAIAGLLHHRPRRDRRRAGARHGVDRGRRPGQRQQARVHRADGGRRRRPVPGQELRPGPGPDDQHDPGPARGQQHPASRRRGPRRRACSAAR